MSLNCGRVTLRRSPLAFVLRLILAVILAVGGLSATHSASALATMPCHDAMIPQHHDSASDSGHASGDKLAHCLAATGVCCTMVMVQHAASEAALVDHVTTLVWSVVLADDLSGQRVEVATPPPRI